MRRQPGSARSRWNDWKMASFCEIVVEDYVDEVYTLEEALRSEPADLFKDLPAPPSEDLITRLSEDITVHLSEELTAHLSKDLTTHLSEDITANPAEDLTAPIKNALQEFDFGLESVMSEPVLETEELSHDDYGYLYEAGTVVATSDDSDASARDSYHSIGSGYPASSNRSSVQVSASPDTDLSSCENSSRGTESDSSAPTTPVDALHRWSSSFPQRPLRYRRPYQPNARVVSVNMGCYVPSGMTAEPAPISALKLTHQRLLSDASSKSIASSLYPEESVQAADIEEVEPRGRKFMARS